MDLTLLAGDEQTRTSGTFVASFLHHDDPEIAGRTALATRSDQGWDELTYDQLDRRSRQVRDWLAAHGVRAGDRVGVMGGSGNDWVGAFFGVLRQGAIAVPLDSRLTATELAPIWARSAPAALITDARVCDVADTPVLPFADIATLARPRHHVADAARSMEQPAVIVWTAGTTGTAKGVSLSFANLDYVVTHSAAGQGLDRDDHWLSLLSLSHMFELSCGLLAALRAGATVCFARSLMPREVVDCVAERRINRMVVVPLVLRLLRNDLARRAAAAGYLRALYCGGAPLSQDLANQYAAMGMPVYQGYGLTELAPTVAMNSPAHNRPGSVGRPLAGTDVRIQDGEILVRSPGLMAGYWLDDELTRAAIDRHGWFHTGDLGRVDADRYLYVTGRVKDLIALDSGRKVQPEEVERVLTTSSLVAEVCVVGVNRVCAVVVPSGDVSDCEIYAEVALRARALSGYKRPTTVVVWRHELPKTAKRSVRRHEVLKLVEES